MRYGYTSRRPRHLGLVGVLLVVLQLLLLLFLHLRQRLVRLHLEVEVNSHSGVTKVYKSTLQHLAY
jgi:hypothetical protein